MMNDKLIDEISYNIYGTTRGISWHDIADLVGKSEHTKIGLKVAKALYDYWNGDNGILVLLPSGHWYNEITTQYSKRLPYSKYIENYLKKNLGIVCYMNKELIGDYEVLYAKRVTD